MLKQVTKMLRKVLPSSYGLGVEGESSHRSKLWRWPVADEWVDEEIALSLSTVWACVHAISESIASSKWKTYTMGRDGVTDEFKGPQANLINKNPNPEMTRFEFVLTMLLNILLRDFCIAEIERSVSGGVPVALWPISSDRVTMVRNLNGIRQYRVQNYYQPDTYLDEHDVFVVRGRALNPESPIALVDAARETLSRAVATRNFGASFFSNGLHPGSVFSPKGLDKPLTKPQLDDLIDSLREQYSGSSRAHAAMALPMEVHYQAMGVEPDKAQYIETERHLVEEICRFYRVPPHLAQHLERATFDNIEELGIQFVNHAIVPWCERFCAEADRKLFRPQQNAFTRFQVDWLKEGNAKDVAETESTRIFSSQSTPDEARHRRGDNPYAGGIGSVPVMQQGMAGLQKIVNGEDDESYNEPDTSDIRPSNEDGGADIDT